MTERDLPGVQLGKQPPGVVGNLLAIAILAMVILGPRMPDEATQLGFIVGWMIMLPVGCWLAIRDTPDR